MRKSIVFAAFCALSFVANSNAVLISTTPVNLYDVLPAGTQGENDVFCQYYDTAVSSWQDLNQRGTYIWQTYLTGALPAIERQPAAGDIRVTPGTVQYNGQDLRPVINVGLEGSGSLRITGSVSTENSKTNYYSIFKGAGNINNPLWTASSGSFDITIPFSNSDRLYFAAAGGDSPTRTLGHWLDVQFVAVPEPLSVSLLVFGTLLLRRK